jgi:hypothetical protein
MQDTTSKAQCTMQRSRCNTVTDWLTIKQYRTTRFSLRSKHELHRCSCHIFPSHQCCLIHRQCSGQAALATFCSLSKRATAPLATAVHHGLVTTHGSAATWLQHACKRSNTTIHVSMDASYAMKAGKASLAQKHTKKASCKLSQQSVCSSSLPVWSSKVCRVPVRSCADEARHLQ